MAKWRAWRVFSYCIALLGVPLLLNEAVGVGFVVEFGDSSRLLVVHNAFECGIFKRENIMTLAFKKSLLLMSWMNRIATLKFRNPRGILDAMDRVI